MTLANATFSEIITFTRASNNATYTNSAGVLQVAATDAPRFEYNPTTLAAQGFLIEEARTNNIVNNLAIGTLAGTPGVVPSDWSVTSTANGVAREVIGLGTENGVEYIEIRYYGTPTASSTVAVTSSLTTTIVAAPGETWAASVYVKLAGGSLSNVTLSNRLNGRTSSGGLLETSTTELTPTNGSLNTQRSLVTGTLANVSTERVTQQIVVTFTVGLAFDVTLRIGLPQLEKAAFATSVIKSTPAFVSRATIGTYIDSSGLVQTAGVNVARYTYNQQDLTQPPYLVIETSRTNLCTYSQDFTQTIWLTNGSTKTTGISDPAGGATAATVTATVANGSVQNAAATVSSGTTYTVSIWIRRRTGTGIVGIRAVENVNTPVTITSTWARYSVTVAAVGTLGRVGVYCQTVGDEIDFWGAQLEASSAASSYYPTTTTALTRATDVSTTATVNRAADVASINTLSPWFNATEGTIFSQWNSFANSVQRYTLSFAQAASTTTDRIDISLNASNIVNPRTVVSGAAVATISGGTYTVNTTVKNAFAYAFANYASSLSGATAIVNSTAGALPASLARMSIGSLFGVNFINGHLQRITYYPQRLTNSQLQALTS